MYPQRELIRLATHKAAMRRNIGRQRAQCTAAAAQVLRPLEWLERMRSFWRRLSPFAHLAAVPLSFLVPLRAHPRLKILGSFLRWGPLVFRAVRAIASSTNSRSRFLNARDRR